MAVTHLANMPRYRIFGALATLNFALKKNCLSMKTDRITFIGSSSHKAARAANKGECLRTVNLRKNNGSLQPVPIPHIHCVLSGSQRTLVYVHTCNDSQHLITTEGIALFHELDIDGNNSASINKQLAIIDDDIAEINSLGNTLIVATPSKIHYFLYHDGSYKYLDNKPPLPTVRLTCSKAQGSFFKADEISMDGKVEKLSEQTITDFSTRLLGTYFKTRNAVHKQNQFALPILARYALRMYDGSYIMPSAPILLGNYTLDLMYNTHYLRSTYDEDSDTTTIESFDIALESYKVQYNFESFDLEDWKDIITHIDIFVSSELSIVEDRNIDNYSYEVYNDTIYAFGYNFPAIDIEELQNNVRNESLYYLYHSIELNNSDTPITLNSPVIIDSNINPSTLIYRPRMEADSESFKQIGAHTSYVYNHRLHLANIHNKYYEGYPPAIFAHTYNSDNDSAVAYTRTLINLNNKGIKEVIATSNIPNFDYKISPTLSFPDSNATSMEIFIRHSGMEYHKSFRLTAASNENRASYINDNLADIDVRSWDCISLTHNDEAEAIPSPSSFTIHDPNLMIVSEANNPFLFTAGLSYNISTGRILGMAATTTALSQGQYGEFPLYVFTDEGIWGMQVGNGEVCYARQTPINNEQLDSNIMLTPTEDAIIYRSGNKLSMISGSHTRELLPLKEFNNTNFDKQLSSFLPLDASQATTDATPLSTFFTNDTVMCYRQKENELIFCNANYPYCIVLHLPTGHIYRLEYKLRNIVNSYNTLLAQGSNNAIFNLNKESSTTTYVSLITHPIQPAHDIYTRLRQVMWRMQGSNALITITIIAAHEPEGNYRIISSFTYSGEISGHLPVKLLTPPYKYYRFIISGNISPDFHIDCADIAFMPVDNNKLR